MNIIISAVAFLVTLGILVFVHEGGHFIAAKALGVRVLKFSLGFGKKIIGFKKGETEYVISMIPLGGFVKMAGETLDEAGIKPGDFLSKPPYQRAIIAFAGPFTNLIIAVLFYAIVLKAGFTVYTYTNEIGYVFETIEINDGEVASPAFKAGILEDDVVVAIDGKPVSTWYDIQNEIWTRGGDEIEITVDRDGTEKKITLTTIVESETGRGIAGFSSYQEPEVYSILEGSSGSEMGIEPGDRLVSINGEPIDDFTDFVIGIEELETQMLTFTFEKESGGVNSVEIQHDINDPLETISGLGVIFGIVEYEVQAGWLQMFPQAVSKVIEAIAMTVKGLALVFTGKVKLVSAFGGPLTIASIAGETARAGWVSFLQFLAYMSVILGFLNLLPIPVLDGGQIVIAGVETVIRRNLPERAREIVTIVGLVLVAGIMILAITADVTRLFSG